MTDLGALLSRLLAVVIEREEPILREHGLTMWEYVVLTAVGAEPGLNQNELAARTRRDPTRLIQHLDALAARGLIVRDVDPRDRRRRVVRLTESGGSTLHAVQADIRAMETTLLGALDRAEQDRLRVALTEVLGG